MLKEIENFRTYIIGIAPMDPATFGLSLAYLSRTTVKKGDFFIQQGKVCQSIAFVDQGLFRLFYLKDGQEVNTCFCKENSIISSFSSLVNETISQDSIQALEDANIITLSYTNLLKLYELSPKWQAVGRLLTEKECLRLSIRASSLSFDTALEKYKNVLTHQPELIQRVSIQNIASYIGVSRETLSRIRSRMAQE